MNRIYPNSVLPLEPGIGTTEISSKRPSGKTDGVAGGGFQDMLRTELQRSSPELRKGSENGPLKFSAHAEGLKFSAHAQQRLASRQIQLSRDAMQRLDQAVTRAAEKGAKDALLLMPGVSRGEDLAFVVSVTNRTVITAMDGEHIRSNVFTNIDSAIVVT